MALVVEFGGFVAVIHGEHKASSKLAPRILYPFAGVQIHFGLLVLPQLDALLSKVILDSARRERAQLFDQPLAVASHIDFAQSPAFETNAVYRKCVQQLIREDAASGN